MKIRIEDYVNEPILLSSRFRYPQKPMLRLNEIQRKTKKKIEKAIRDGELKFVAVDCRCGQSKDLGLSQVDRYGLWVRTVLCQNCGLVRTSPRLNSESLSTFYEKFYRPLYSGFQQADDAFFLSQVTRGKQILDLVVAKCNLKGGIVFDVGTGAGGTLFPFLQAGWRVIGVDVGSQYLDYGRSEGLELHEGSFDFFINRGLKADLLILCHVFEHLEDLDRAVSKIRQCLKPDGFVYIEVPGIFNISSAYENNFLRYLQNAHLYHFSLQTLSNVLRENGFELIYGTEHVKSIFHPRTDFSATTLSSASCEEVAKEILVYVKQMDSIQGRLKGKMVSMRAQARRLGVRALKIMRLKGIAKNSYTKLKECARRIKVSISFF